MIWFLYNSLFVVVFLLLTPHFLWRMRRRGGYRANFEQRIGCYSRAFRSRASTRPRIWLHAVSVGEVFVALEFMAEVRRQRPESAFVLSVTTSTGHRIAGEKLAEEDLLIYFPIDLPWIMKKVLGVLRPQQIILVECEIWPNLIRLAAAEGIPVSLINGRMSDSSFRGYRKLSFFTRRILPMVKPLCMQGERDRDRMLALGAIPETALALGSAKFDVAPAGKVENSVAREVLSRAGMEGRTLLLGGSTWPGEEEILVDLYLELKAKHPDLALVLVPRHFERGPDILSMLEEKGQRAVQRSKLSMQSDTVGAEQAESPGVDPVLLVDSTGELLQFYQAADLIFVGKSLCEQGGQNPLESAALGKATVVGPHMENFPSVMEILIKDEAVVQVKNRGELKDQFDVLLSDSAARHELGERAANSVAAHRGVLKRTAARVLEERESSCSAS